MKNLIKKGFLLIFISMIVSLPAFSQDLKGGPGLLLTEREFDYGKVKEGSIIKHDFIILNQGDAVLEIRRVSPG